MLKKILLTSITLSLYLNANSNLNENITCSEEFESCATKCEKIESYEKNIMCIEQCESIFDKCLILEETSAEILMDDENKNTIESEKETF
jgi:hypothetical protein